MNNRIIAVVAGLIILVGAGAIFLFTNKTPTNNKASESLSPTQSASTNNLSLTDLLSMGKNQQCNFSVKGASTTTGVVYISSASKIRGNFQVVSSGKTSNFSMIRSGDYNYIWGDDFPTGMKMKLSLDELSKNSQANQYVNPAAKVDYHCINWNVDESVFSVPTNIKFTDIGAMKIPTGAMKAQVPDGTNPCASISDPTAKAACESAMKK